MFFLWGAISIFWVSQHMIVTASTRYHQIWNMSLMIWMYSNGIQAWTITIGGSSIRLGGFNERTFWTCHDIAQFNHQRLWGVWGIACFQFKMAFTNPQKVIDWWWRVQSSHPRMIVSNVFDIWQQDSVSISVRSQQTSILQCISWSMLFNKYQ